MPKLILISLLILMSLVQLSCQRNDRHSVLVIAADELISTDIRCSPESTERSGFQLFCKESVRFTHAFTPSTQSVPALASTLTGLYPFEHKVRHNGGPGLNAESLLVSEVALRDGYRTSFFSGGAPVFRRSGLHQGFEVFEDNITPSMAGLFRPFKKSADLFIQWLEQEVDGAPFFTVIYAPDLLFSTTPTTTDLGDLRNLSFESQLDELDESLYELILNLKSLGRWDRTTVILMGLNGHTGNDRNKELAPLNLHSENTQVALYIKPAQPKKRDQALNWKMDSNVTLVDIGRTLFDLLGQNIQESAPETPSYSLLPSLNSPGTETWSEDRPILIESGWALWRAAGPLRTAALAGHVLLINDEPTQLFNTLVDRFEVNPLPMLQQSILGTTRKLQGVIKKNGFPPFSGISNEWIAKLSIPFSRWMRADQESLLLRDLKRLSASYPNSLQLTNWTAQISLNQRDWETLRQLGMKNQVSIWQHVAERNLQSKKLQPHNDACFDLISSSPMTTSELKECSDPLFLELIDYIRAEERGLSKDTQRSKFERSFRYYMLDQSLQRANIASRLLWDTSRENIYTPSRTELALHLPELAKVRLQTYKFLSSQESGN